MRDDIQFTNKAFNKKPLLTKLFIVACLLSTSISNAYAGDFFKGQTIYATYCQSCHGSAGRGELSGAPNFTRGQGLMKPDFQLYDSVIRGRNTMPGFQGVIKDEDIYNVISYIRSFY